MADSTGLENIGLARPGDGHPNQKEASQAADQKLWNSAYSAVHQQNHYEKGEGPKQALLRLEKSGVLPAMTMPETMALAHKKVGAELGDNGSLHRNFYKTSDHVLSQTEEKSAVESLFAREKKHSQAERLAPSDAQLSSAMTPQVQADFAHAGLKSMSPEQLRNGIVNAMDRDQGLSGQQMEKMKTAPVGAPYVATGAVTEAQLKSVLDEQKAARQAEGNDPAMQALKTSDPAEYKKEWGQYLASTDVGKILKDRAVKDPSHFNAAKIAAADELITNLQKQR